MRFERPVLPDHIKAEAARRIDARFPIWRQLNAMREGGDPVMTAYIDGVRAASNALETKTPIPPDYQDDRYWPEKI